MAFASVLDSPPSQGGGDRSRGSLFGQPIGLTVLFLTETWEKFSFYGMRSLLILYMVKQLHFSQDKASLIYGLYSGLTYLTPIFGGMASDRWLGRRICVVVGGTIMALGHFLMSFEPLFYVALVVIIVGNGLYLPSVPGQVGSLYERSDPRRESAYTIYYVGVNLGAFLAPLICGTLGQIYGWHYGFAAAGIGMCIGVVTYLAGGRYLPAERARQPATSADRLAGNVKRGLKTVLLLLAVGAAVVMFRGAYEQIGNSVALWADTDVNRTVRGSVIPTSWLQSLNPLLILMLSVPLFRLWLRLAKQGKDMSSLQKMSTGAAILCGAYLLLAGISRFASVAGNQPSWIWLLAFVLLLTIAELYILPIGLGLFARLAPESLGATTIAAWYLAAFAGNLLAGVLGTGWLLLGHATFFSLIAVVAIVAAIFLRALNGMATLVEANRRSMELLTNEGH